MTIFYIILGLVICCLIIMTVSWIKSIRTDDAAAAEYESLKAEAKRIVKEREAEKKERKRLRKLFRNQGNSNITDVAQGKC